MKSYRSRTLNRQCQVVKAGPNGQPLKDEHGNHVLDFGGQWFFHISGGDHHDRKRVIPVDHAAFFKLKADEINDVLRSRGKQRTVNADEVYAEYVKAFRKPCESYVPPGQPQEFSIVLAKELCVNWTHGFGNTAGGPPTSIPPEQTSIYLRLMAGEDVPHTPETMSVPTAATIPEENHSKRRGKQKAADREQSKEVTLEELGLE